MAERGEGGVNHLQHVCAKLCVGLCEQGQGLVPRPGQPGNARANAKRSLVQNVAAPEGVEKNGRVVQPLKARQSAGGGRHRMPVQFYPQLVAQRQCGHQQAVVALGPKLC